VTSELQLFNPVMPRDMPANARNRATLKYTVGCRYLPYLIFALFYARVIATKSLYSEYRYRRTGRSCCLDLRDYLEAIHQTSWRHILTTVIFNPLPASEVNKNQRFNELFGTFLALALCGAHALEGMDHILEGFAIIDTVDTVSPRLFRQQREPYVSVGSHIGVRSVCADKAWYVCWFFFRV
jgi:hypothetical protein